MPIICTICWEPLTEEETVLCSNDGLTPHHASCGLHLEDALGRLRREAAGDEAALRRIADLERENERLLLRNRRLASAVTDMAGTVEDLQQKLKRRAH